MVNLKPCRDCGQQVSTKAPTCPHCGVGAPPTQVTLSECVTLLLVIVVGVILAVILVPGSDSPSTPQAIARTYTPEQRAASQEVMAAARTLCNIYEEASHLVVECGWDIPTTERDLLRFATAIADADVILTGNPRSIYYYLPGGTEFAKADPLRGVRLR